MEENKKKKIMIIGIIAIIIVIAIIVGAIFFVKNKDKIGNKINNNSNNSTKVEENNNVAIDENGKTENNAVKQETTEEQGEAKTTAEQKVEEYVTVKEDGAKLNKSEKMAEERNIDGLKIEKLQLTSKNSQTQILAEVTNTTSSKKETTLITATLLDKEGNEIVKLNGIIKQLEPGEKTQLNINSSLDYSNAFDVKIEKK